MTDPAAPPGETLRRIITGFQPTHLIGLAARLGLPDLLADGPRTSVELAELVHADPDALYRILRALAHLGVFAMLEDGSFALTPVGACLRSDTEDSLRPVALLWSSDHVQRP